MPPRRDRGPDARLRNHRAALPFLEPGRRGGTPGRWRCFMCTEFCPPGWQTWFELPPAPPELDLVYEERHGPAGQPPTRWFVVCSNCWCHNRNCQGLCRYLISHWFD